METGLESRFQPFLSQKFKEILNFVFSCFCEELEVIICLYIVFPYINYLLRGFRPNKIAYWFVKNVLFLAGSLPLINQGLLFKNSKESINSVYMIYNKHLEIF